MQDELEELEIQLDIGENWYDPPRFVEALAYAEELGFRTAWFGDHFMPWFHSGDRSQFVWSMMGAALERTKKIRTGPLVTPPIGARYHPAIVAQASATLDNLFPGRFLLGVGSGEALNERPFWNGRWPAWNERMERLTEGIQLIRRLWESKKPFSFHGKYFGADFYYLYTKPRTHVAVYFAGLGPKAAYIAGKYADRLVTLSPRNTAERLKDVILPSYARGMKEGRRREGGLIVHLDFSLMKPEEMKRREWKELGWIQKDSWSISDPVAAERQGRKVTMSQLRNNIHFVKGWRELLRVIETYADAGAEAVVLISEANLKKIKEFADNVLHLF